MGNDRHTYAAPNTLLPGDTADDDPFSEEQRCDKCGDYVEPLAGSNACPRCGEELT